MYPSYQFWQSWINWFEWLSHICLTDQNHLSAYFDQFQPNAFDWTTTIEKLPQDTFLYRQRDEDIFIDKKNSILNTVFFTKFFPCRIQYLEKIEKFWIWYQIFSIPNLILFIPNFNAFWIPNFSILILTLFKELKSFKIKKFCNQNITLCIGQCDNTCGTKISTKCKTVQVQIQVQVQVQMQMRMQVVPFGNWTFPQLQLQ